MDKEQYRCLYCASPCTIDIVDGKKYLDCYGCGRKEATDKLEEELKKQLRKRQK